MHWFCSFLLGRVRNGWPYSFSSLGSISALSCFPCWRFSAGSWSNFEFCSCLTCLQSSTCFERCGLRGRSWRLKSCFLTGLCCSSCFCCSFISSRLRSRNFSCRSWTVRRSFCRCLQPQLSFCTIFSLLVDPYPPISHPLSSSEDSTGYC